MREAGLARRFRSRQWRAGAAAALAAAFVAASCLVLGQHSRHGGHSAGSLEQDGRSLAALERQRARLQSFISEQDGSGRPTARSVPEAGEGHTVAAVKATDSTANRMHCGKLPDSADDSEGTWKDRLAGACRAAAARGKTMPTVCDSCSIVPCSF